MKVEKFTSLISALAVTATVFTPFSASHAETEFILKTVIL